MGTSERGCTDIKTSLNELIEVLGAIALALLIVVLVLPKRLDQVLRGGNATIGKDTIEGTISLLSIGGKRTMYLNGHEARNDWAMDTHGMAFFNKLLEDIKFIEELSENEIRSFLNLHINW